MIVNELLQKKFKSHSQDVFPCAEITPQVAKLILTNHNNNNVSPNQARINRYAYDMQNGLFKFNGDSIRFDKNGRLLDGQNRLMACVKADTSFLVNIQLGLEEEVFETIDQGRIKTSSLLLHSAFGDNYGLKRNHSAALSTAVKHYLSFDYHNFLTDSKNSTSGPASGHVRWSRGEKINYNNSISEKQEFINKLSSPKYINDLVKKDYEDIINYNRSNITQRATWILATKFIFSYFNNNLTKCYNKGVLIFLFKIFSERTDCLNVVKYFFAELATNIDKNTCLSLKGHTLKHVKPIIDQCNEVKPKILMLYLTDTWNSIIKGGLTSRGTGAANKKIYTRTSTKELFPIEIENEEKTILPDYCSNQKLIRAINKATDNGSIFEY